MRIEDARFENDYIEVIKNDFFKDIQFYSCNSDDDINCQIDLDLEKAIQLRDELTRLINEMK